MPRVSVTMPTRNRRGFIAGAAQMFLSQTYTDAELVIVDGGDDGTAELVPTHPRIRYEKPRLQGQNTGTMRNLCAEAAQGAVLIHMDSDDWYSPAYIATMVASLDASKKQVIGLHEMLYWDAPNNCGYRAVAEDLPYASGYTLTYYKDWWQKHPFESRPIGEDSSFSFQAYLHRELASFMNPGIAVARRHSSNTCPIKQNRLFMPLTRDELPKELTAM